MCDEALVEGKYCSTVGELRRAVGGDVSVPGPHSSRDDDCCLCIVDMDETASRNGFVVEMRDDDSPLPLFVLRRASQTTEQS